MSQELMIWAVPRLQRLLPIDDESLKEIVTYTTTLSKEAGAEHLKNMLGDSPQAFEFISGFNSRRPDVKPPTSQAGASSRQVTNDGGVPKHVKKQKQKAPLHNAGPVRRPEGYGDVSGAYTKQQDQDFGARGHKKGNSAANLSDALSLSQQPDALQLPRVSQGGLQTPSPGRSRDPSPGNRGSPSLMPPSASGKLISDLPNVRTKQSKKPAHATQSYSQPQSGTSTPHGHGKGASTTTSSIADLTSAIAALELSTNPTLSSERRKCDCNASIHPLFTTAPNCINCGKIICALEGLQPCSFCDSPILSREQVNGMIRALKEERGIEKTVTHNVSVAGGRSGGATPMFGSSPDVSGDEGSSAASRARAHRDRLLAFQRENAQRTKVHDEASDYDMTLTHGATQWMTPTQRAAALKKQQQYIREMEDANRPEWEKKRTMMSLSVKNGKLVKTFERVKAEMPKTEVEEEIVDEEVARDDERQKLGGSGAFSNNPLLKGGALIRPVWKPKDGEVAGAESAGKKRERKSVWRRVQDDTEDNEQWILDGGLRGYGVESRLMEDGSQQECG
ncbi:hypothetical protein PMZ80_001877 [Knufia obscura]|uniref:TRIP4/RQT4 C2HC5-type zinc finger domain-containing protein n=2 Tax=Knufia TaxID=430999 RepID=A0AAN8F965_9EURO|nr:hypothetical protein PMZ80_001877 [Knufia obscura]KAK5953696.1 hypothetical protein OHC33_004965 [Knufia fluminis]